jgi:tetratricopeptide (TPR) repeat protein
VLVLAAAATAAGWWWRTVHHTRTREEALRLSRQGEFTKAEPLLLRAVAHDADDADVVKALAQGYLAAQQLPQAETYLNRWCALRPDQAEPLGVHMDMAHELGKPDQVIADGLRLLELEPDKPQTQRRVISLFFTIGRHAEVERVCRRSLQRYPHNHFVEYVLAEACHAQENDAEARAILDRLLQERPSFADAQLLRAVLYYDAGQDDKAIPLLRQVVAQDPAGTAPTSKPAHYYLSLALTRTGQAAEANDHKAKYLQQSDLDRLLIDVDFQPNNLELQVKVAEALLKSGRMDDGVRRLQMVLAREPGNVAARRLQAGLAGFRGEPRKVNP